MLRRLHISLVMLLVALMIAAIGPLTAAAQEAASTPAAEPPRFDIRTGGDQAGHAYFEATLKPGAQADLTTSIGNGGQGSVSLLTYAANAISVANGGFGALGSTDKQTGPTTWLDFKGGSLDLKPGERVEQSFTVSVPADTAPGEYVTALVAQTSEALPIPGTTTFNQIIRSAVAILITVPGEMESGFELGKPAFNIKTAISSLDIPITNTGTTILKPKGELTVATSYGTDVITSPIELGSIYTGNTTKILIPLPDQLKPGDYVVSLKLTDPESKATAELKDVPATLPDRNAPPPVFTIGPTSVEANGDPIQYADVSATINNDGSAIPTAKIVLHVQRDGKDVEDYSLAEGRALPNGETTIQQRYIPAGGWQSGTYTFEIVVSAVSGSNGTETLLAKVEVEDTVVVP